MRLSGPAHDRSPVWSPDGERVAWFSDASGEYQLLVREHRGRDEARAYDLGAGGFFYDPSWSPDGEHLLFTDKWNRLAILELEGGTVTPVASVQGSLGTVRPRAVWSPDSEWIALEHRNPHTAYGRIALYELASGKLVVLTDAFGHASSPAFSPAGELLFFTASVSSGPNHFDLDMSSSAARPASANLYVAVLQTEGESPLAARSDEGNEERADEEEEPDGDESDEEAENAEQERPELPPIELAGLDQRILALPLGGGNYRGLACTEDALLFVEQPRGGQPRLRSYDLEKREAETLREGVRSFQLSADGKSLLLRSSNGWSIAGTDASDPDELGIDSAMVRVVPAEEWTQILREVWRIQRDYFYDENLHGVDWPAMWERWSPFLEHVRHRAELDLLVRSLTGELACGHQYAGGGGQAADYVISVLGRQLDSWWLNREQWASRTPFGVIEGPKVMVINEYAGSGGDWMPWAFQKRGLGPLVGTRTWGGLVGISGYPVLMDGGSVTAASFGVMDTDGRWAVENVGVAPDVEVIEWPQEVLAGRDPQLERAVELALELLDQKSPRGVPEYYPPVER